MTLLQLRTRGLPNVQNLPELDAASVLLGVVTGLDRGLISKAVTVSRNVETLLPMGN